MQINFPDFKNTYAEFFAGCGGLSLGFEQAGLKCVSALERDVAAAHTFYQNLCYGGWSHVWVDPTDDKLIKNVSKWGKETSNFLFPDGVDDDWLTSPKPTPCLNLFVSENNLGMLLSLPPSCRISFLENRNVRKAKHISANSKGNSLLNIAAACL